MINPYFSFSGGFIIALVLFALPWSSLYPPLSIGVLTFLLVMICLSTLFGLIWRKKVEYTLGHIEHNSRTATFITVGITILWIAEFVHAGGIPFFMIVTSQPFNYTKFGIPTLHVFIVTFSSFYTIFLFHVYRCSSNKVILLLVVLQLTMAVLIYNRGMLLFNLTSIASVYLLTANKVKLKVVAISLPFAIVLLYVFGVLGTMRVSHLAGTPYSNEHFMNLGKASSQFRNGNIPHEFFWSYIYISSPVANLQENVDKYLNREVTQTNVVSWVNNEVMMDFISKRINSMFDLQPAGDFRIHGNLTAPTIFSRSYSYLGFTGLIFMGVVVLILPLFILKVLPSSSPLFTTTIAILCTMYLFMMFENTIRFTGLSFQLIYPLVLHFIYKRLPHLQTFFVNNKVTHR